MAFCLFWYEFNTGCFPPESGDWEEQVSNRMMVAVYVLCRVVRQEGVIGCFLWLPMRENLRGFSQRLMRFYLKKKVSIPCLEDAVLQPPVLQDSSGKERGVGWSNPSMYCRSLKPLNRDPLSDPIQGPTLFQVALL